LSKLQRMQGLSLVSPWLSPQDDEESFLMGPLSDFSCFPLQPPVLTTIRFRFCSHSLCRSLRPPSLTMQCKTDGVPPAAAEEPCVRPAPTQGLTDGSWLPSRSCAAVLECRWTESKNLEKDKVYHFGLSDMFTALQGFLTTVGLLSA